MGLLPRAMHNGSLAAVISNSLSVICTSNMYCTFLKFVLSIESAVFRMRKGFVLSVEFIIINDNPRWNNTLLNSIPASACGYCLAFLASVSACIVRKTADVPFHTECQKLITSLIIIFIAYVTCTNIASCRPLFHGRRIF